MAAISGVLGAIGLGAQIFGGISSSENASQQAAVQLQMAQKEGQIQEQRQNQMVLDSRRQQLEIVRNGQRARAMALNAATNQGAQFGSGLAGGYGQISGQTNTNLLANQQNTQIGNNIYGMNSDISGYKMQLGQLQSQQATNQGYMSLGGALLKAGPTIGNLFQGFGGSSSNSYSYPTYGGFINGINSNGIY